MVWLNSKKDVNSTKIGLISKFSGIFCGLSQLSVKVATERAQKTVSGIIHFFVDVNKWY